MSCYSPIIHKLLYFGSVIESVRTGKSELKEIDSVIAEVESWINSKNLNTCELLWSYYILSHSFSTKRSLSLSPQYANYNNPLIWKEVSSYRSIFKLSNEVVQSKDHTLFSTARDIRYQADVQLGALYDHFGRFQNAQNLWFQAGILKKNDFQWRFHIGFSLASTHAYYEKRAEPFVLAHAKSILKPFLDMPETMCSAVEVYEKIKNYKTPDLSEDISIIYDDTEKGCYDKWVNEHWLRLNSYNDINTNSNLSQDDSLYFLSVFSPDGDSELGQRVFTQLNEIKQEYVSARYMLYQYFTKSGQQHFSDSDVVLSDNLDYSNYSYYIELAKASFRALYSILDKTAYLLNDYLGLGVKGNDVNFNDIWYSDKKKHTLREKILSFESNYSLAGLLFIRNDIFGGDSHYIQDEATDKLRIIRNAIEHRSVLIVDDGRFDDTQYALIISRAEFEETIMNLIRTVRQAIFCIVNMVNHIEYDKRIAIEQSGQKVIFQPVSVIADEDKV